MPVLKKPLPKILQIMRAKGPHVCASEVSPCVAGESGRFAFVDSGLQRAIDESEFAGSTPLKVPSWAVACRHTAYDDVHAEVSTDVGDHY